MIHPIYDVKALTDEEIDNKLLEANKKYFLANNNLKEQILMIIESLQLEQENRRIKNKDKKEFDNFIKVV